MTLSCFTLWLVLLMAWPLDKLKTSQFPFPRLGQEGCFLWACLGKGDFPKAKSGLMSIPLCQAVEHTGGHLLPVVSPDERVRSTKAPWWAQGWHGWKGSHDTWRKKEALGNPLGPA